jgi:hypothetical protein
MDPRSGAQRIQSAEPLAPLERGRDSEAVPIYEAFVERVRRVHGEDPKGAAERYHATLVSYLEELVEAPSEALLIAGWCQHVRRWTLSRDAYPRTTAGYRRWRSELGRRHAETARELALEVGFPEEIAARAGQIILHKALARDPDGMTLEDAACLTFLKLEAESFAEAHAQRSEDPSEVVAILRKTWGKMSDRGREVALRCEARGDFPPAVGSLLRRALEAPPG